MSNRITESMVKGFLPTFEKIMGFPSGMLTCGSSSGFYHIDMYALDREGKQTTGTYRLYTGTIKECYECLHFAADVTYKLQGLKETKKAIRQRQAIERKNASKGL